HLLLARNGKSHAARRLRSVIARRTQGARPRSEPDRRHRAFAFARRPFRRTPVPPAGRPVPYAARAPAVDRRAAWHTRAARPVTRSVLSEIHHEQVAVLLGGHGD